MKSVLHRDSFNFNCNLNDDHNSSSYGSYRDGESRKPEICVITKSELSEKSEDSDVITNLIGHNGRWQFIWTFLLTLFQISPTCQILGFAFQTAVKDFWCARPNKAPNMDVALWRNLSQPDGACSILNLNYSQITVLSTSDIEYAQRIPCTKFEFSSDEVGARSLVEEFGLVCSHKDLIFVMEMSFLAGAALGSVTSGLISDHFGRKHTLMTSLLVQTVSGILVAYSINTTMFMSLRFISGFSAITVTGTCFVLVVELVSGKWRTVIGILCLLPISLSFVLIACIAYFVRDWRNLQFIISLPFLSFLLLWYCMPESPRWLLAQGRINELSLLIERAARLNRRSLPPNYREILKPATPQQQQQQQQTTQSAFMVSADRNTNNCGTINLNLNEANPTTHDNPLKVVFNRYYCRTTCFNFIVWLALIIIYFGLSLHLGNLGGNLYLNSIVAGGVEALSVCASIFVVLKVGMRRSLIAFMLMPGLLCLSPNLLSNRDEHQIPVVAMAIVAKCIIGASNAILPSYTAMQYPTVVRNFGVGLGSLASGISLILIPYLWRLEQFDPLLPMSIMGISGIVGAISIYMMRDIEQQRFCQ